MNVNLSIGVTVDAAQKMALARLKGEKLKRLAEPLQAAGSVPFMIFAAPRPHPTIL